MRVHELAKELGVTSAEVIGAAREVQVPVDHASNALTDDEAERLRAALSGAERGAWERSCGRWDASEAEREAPETERDAPEPEPPTTAGAEQPTTAKKKEPVRAFRLVGKRSVTCRGVKVERGGRAEGAWVAALPARLRTCFEEV